MIKLNVKIRHGTNAHLCTLVFIHGNSQNLHFWGNQLKEPILRDHNLMAIDLPGHGNSPKMEDYTVPNLISILSEHINQLGPNIIIAHSLGGHLTVQSLSKIKNCKGMMLIGTPPLRSPLNMQEAFAPDERMGLLFKENLSSDDRSSLCQFIGYADYTEWAMQALAQTDPKFRSDMASSIALGEMTDEIVELKKADFPVALVAGAYDALINKEYLEWAEFPMLWRKKVQFVANAKHAPHLECPRTFNVVLTDFVNDILKDGI